MAAGELRKSVTPTKPTSHIKTTIDLFPATRLIILFWEVFYKYAILYISLYEDNVQLNQSL